MTQQKRAASLRPFSFFGSSFFSFLGTLLLFCHICAISTASQPPEEKLRAIASSRYWKALLHYRKANLGIGPARSESDGPEFFLSPEGSHDLLAELKASLTGFAPESQIRIGKLRQHPQCAFPERWRFIKQELGSIYKDLECKDFLEWKKGFNLRSVTVVYAAPYLGSPASLFGHTFLRLDFKPRAGHSEKNDLLDYGVSFEAFTGTDASVLYAIKGVLGFYEGHFYLFPYYLKINSYNDLDARDLWEYQLTLDPNEIDRMVNHLWELGSTHFDYYFFDENCSYHLLSLIETARPELDLRSPFLFMTVPADTLKILARTKGLVADRHYRPSILGVLQARLERMTQKEKADFRDYKDRVNETPSETSVATLDALLDWQKYEAANKGLPLEQVDSQLSLHLLRLRAAHREPPAPLDFSKQQSTPPDLGHDSTKISLYAGRERSGSLIGFEFRGVFHDFLDGSDGYLPHTQLTILKVRAEALAGEKTKPIPRLRELTGVEVATLAPWTSLRKNFAWKIGAGLMHPLDLECEQCLLLQGRGGIGISVGLSDWAGGDWLAWGMGIARVEAGPVDLGYRLLPGVEFGSLLQITPRLKSLISVAAMKDSRLAHRAPRDMIESNFGFAIGLGRSEIRTTFVETQVFDKKNATKYFNSLLVAFARYY